MADETDFESLKFTPLSKTPPEQVMQRGSKMHKYKPLKGNIMSHKSKHAPRKPNPVDIHVGSRVRLQRQLLKMSQEKLGDALGVTSQQVQKYEKGANRVGASRLYRLAEVLDVPVSFFFEGLDPVGSLVPSEDELTIQEFIGSTGGVKLAKAYCGITSNDLRNQVLELARALN